jgi:hypothetical protein
MYPTREPPHRSEVTARVDPLTPALSEVRQNLSQGGAPKAQSTKQAISAQVSALSSDSESLIAEWLIADSHEYVETYSVNSGKG